MIKIGIFSLLFALLYLVYAEDASKEMKIDVQENGKIDVDGGMSYYTLKIPQKIQKNKYNLVLRLKETDLADAGQEDFSDPDIYVSKVNSILYFNLDEPETEISRKFKMVFRKIWRGYPQYLVCSRI
jgi:hypothetical protein